MTKGRHRNKGYGGGHTPKLNKEPFTHFLCIPLITECSRPQLVESLTAFREHTKQPRTKSSLDVGNEMRSPEPAESSGAYKDIPLDALRAVDTLHLTLGMMSLKNEEQIFEAKHFLDGLNLGRIWTDLFGSAGAATSDPGALQSDDERGAPHITISLRGLHPMQKPQAATVLYAAPHDPTDRLHKFCVAIKKEATEAGWVAEESRPLKLHATVVNTIYARKDGRQGVQRTHLDRGVAAVPLAGPAEMETRIERDLEAEEMAAIENGDKTAESAKTAEVGDRRPRNLEAKTKSYSSRRGRPMQLDATEWVNRYKDHVWAEDIVLQKLSIYKMGATKVRDAAGIVTQEYYEELASVPLYQGL